MVDVPLKDSMIVCCLQCDTSHHSVHALTSCSCHRTLQSCIRHNISFHSDVMAIIANTLPVCAYASHVSFMSVHTPQMQMSM